MLLLFLSQDCHLCSAALGCVLLFCSSQAVVCMLCRAVLRHAMLCRRGLEQLVDEGLVVSLGLSNCSLAQVEEVLAAAKHKPVCNQVGAQITEISCQFHVH